MNYRSKTIAPEAFGKARLVQHRSDPLRWKPISTLCNSILLGSIPDSMLAKNATLGGKIDEGIAHILPSLVIAQDLDLSLALVLSKGLERLKGLKCLGLGLQRDNKAKSRVVVDESDPVSIPGHGDVAYIVVIAVDEFQRSGGAP